jgi:hypothetical protein
MSRLEEAKALIKGKGKNKGRSQGVRATGSRASRVKAQRSSGKVGRATANKRNTTVNSDLHWYDDDQVTVYDPMREEEIELILGSREFKDLYRTLRVANMAEKALIYNHRTDDVVNFYGDTDGAGPDSGGEDYYSDDDDEDYREEEFYWEQTVNCTRTVTFADDPISPSENEPTRGEESSLGRDRLVLTKFKGGVATTDEGVSISAIVISGRVIIMNHFIKQVKGKTFNLTLSGQTFRVDKMDGCPLGASGELFTYPLPRIQGFKSSKLILGKPLPILNGCEAVLVRFDSDGPAEVSAGTWHDGSYSSFTQKGWCGSAVMVFPPKGTAVMVGVHRWGEGPEGLNACEPFDQTALEYFKRIPPHPANVSV